MFIYTNVRCLRVIDGDTIECAILLTPDSLTIKPRIRLAGIDTPEMNEIGGDEAKEFMIDRIQNKKIELQVTGKDSFGRWIGTVFHDSYDICQMLLDAGLAEVYKKDKKAPKK